LSGVGQQHPSIHIAVKLPELLELGTLTGLLSESQFNSFIREFDSFSYSPSYAATFLPDESSTVDCPNATSAL
jgi:hypothetical protein